MVGNDAPGRRTPGEPPSGLCPGHGAWHLVPRALGALELAADPGSDSEHRLALARDGPPESGPARRGGSRGPEPRRAVCYSHLTYRQLDQDSDRIALGLGASGIAPGTRAAVMVSPGLDLFALTFALFKAGVVPVLIDPGMGLKSLGKCLKEAAPELFIGIPKAVWARRLLGWGRESVRRVILVAPGRKRSGLLTLDDLRGPGRRSSTRACRARRSSPRWHQKNPPRSCSPAAARGRPRVLFTHTASSRLRSSGFACSTRSRRGRSTSVRSPSSPSSPRRWG